MSGNDPLDDGATERTWSARSVRPIIALYVLVVFLAFMALAQFLFHSGEAVRALFLATLGSLGALVPSMLSRIEYRMTDEGLWRRPLRTKEPKEFEQVFSWEEIGHLIPTRDGFKFYKELEETNPLGRFFKFQISDRYSGEIHVDSEDRHRILAMADQRGIPISKASRGLQVRPASTGSSPDGCDEERG